MKVPPGGTNVPLMLGYGDLDSGARRREAIIDLWAELFAGDGAFFAAE
jgi:hypothetical protein